MTNPEEKIKEVVAEIEKGLVLIHKEKERIKENRKKIKQLHIDIRNEKIIKEVEILLAFEEDFFDIYQKIAYKYKLTPGTVKEIYYRNRTK